MRHFWARLWESLSTAGLVVAALFFAASLTPSLIPRNFLFQGVLSGLSLAAGYGVGSATGWLWSALQLPAPEGRIGRVVTYAAAALLAGVGVTFLWQAAAWQNSIRALMGLAPVDSAHPLRVGLIALAIFALVMGLARLFQLTSRVSARRLGRFTPSPVAKLAGGAVALLLFWSLVDGVLLRYALHVADSSFQSIDALMEDNAPQPIDPAKTGSAASLIGWEGLGRAGREFIATGPTKETIGTFLGREAKEPIRVYAGLNSAEMPEARAKLALDELKRAGGFDRAMLVIVTPTGTGWVDPAAMDTLEYLQGGDVASVAIQYSYLASWLSLLVEPDYGREAARALFREVYGYWTTLPRDKRPKLYLHGLSLGALNSDRSADLFDVLADPYQGALWSGPPFPSNTWRQATAERLTGTPAWLPRFRDGSVIRFTGQDNALALPGAQWGPLRIVYLQYASDPIVFFEPASFYRAPAWFGTPRGPDVSPQLAWYPMVSFLQLLLDMATATTAPMGHGHVYAPEHYIDAWIEVTDQRGWTPAEIERLKRHFAR